MRQEALKAVHVATTPDGDEYYEVGRGGVTSIEWGGVTSIEWGGVTSIEWGGISGHMAELDTVRVFVNGQLSSEHPFCNCLGVFFAKLTKESE
ncbi:hypothetical protein HBA54_28100 [Pelagibius litoralis]|uniref:Uncharacterized protein n=1 Tax=Pelagibius litoralis TaxID=374515 RepID=A0A967F3K0_9PROT|nr:hypothetical protein [Pelagibius litoralis]NIA72455.1 hypothetical protein [Pelagibius litoralis]